jgi:hypothetical protein
MGGQRHAPVALSSGPVWTGAENLAPTRIRSPDRPVRGESLYWLISSSPNIHAPVGFEHTISAGERPQTYALDRAATGTGVDW